MLIALYAYGSIVNQPFSSNYENGIELSSNFEQTNILVPLSFSRFSSLNTKNERLTLVPDKNGIETTLFCATMKPSKLKIAIKQLKAREGITGWNVYSDKFVSYVKKGALKEGDTEKAIMIGDEVWSYRKNNISKSKVIEIVKHLKSQGYEAGIITTFDSNTASIEERRERITSKPLIQANSKKYYDDLPESVKNVHTASLKSIGVL